MHQVSELPSKIELHGYTSFLDIRYKYTPVTILCEEHQKLLIATIENLKCPHPLLSREKVLMMAKRWSEVLN